MVVHENFNFNFEFLITFNKEERIRNFETYPICNVLTFKFHDIQMTNTAFIMQIYDMRLSSFGVHTNFFLMEPVSRYITRSIKNS